MYTLIKNGNVYDSKKKAFHKVDLLIKDTVLVSIGSDLDSSNHEVINANGLLFFLVLSIFTVT